MIRFDNNNQNQDNDLLDDAGRPIPQGLVSSIPMWPIIAHIFGWTGPPAGPEEAWERLLKVKEWYE